MQRNGGVQKLDEVSVLFTKNGIIPVRFKVPDEDQETQVFKIHKYKPAKQHMKEEKLYFGDVRSVPDILDFECIIKTALNMSKIVTLRYWINKMEWYVIY